MQDDIYDEFVARITKKMSEVTITDALTGIDADMSSLVSKSQVYKISEMVEFAKKEGAEVLVGGKRPEQFNKGYYYEPTLLTNVKQNMGIVQEEVFGPVLPVMKFSTVEEAIALSNNCLFGLTSSVFSENFNTIMKVTNDLQFGETSVNREHFECYARIPCRLEKIRCCWCRW